MAKANESGKVRATESSDIRTYTQEEVDALLADATRDNPNPAPAIEEGPHLKGDIAEVKRKQLEDAGIAADDETITDDMRRLLKGK